MHNEIERRVDHLLRGSLVKMGLELVGCQYISQGRHSILRIYIDKEGGTNLDDCQKVMAYVNPLLAVEAILPGQYRLEVSSPGLDRPLFTLEQFRQYIGSMIQLRMVLPIMGRRNFKGKLVEVKTSMIVILADGEQIELSVNGIDKANLLQSDTG